jgi:hypothetical protein
MEFFKMAIDFPQLILYIVVIDFWHTIYSRREVAK